MHKFFAIAAFAASAIATPAYAQETTPSDPAPGTSEPAAPTISKSEINAKALILQPATITAGDDLDFGTVLASAIAGTVTVNSSPLAGQLVTDSPGATSGGGASLGSFRGNGEPGSQVTVVVTSDAVLTHGNGSDKLPFSTNTHGAGIFNIANDGLFKVLVGGTINVAANQAPGQYSGKVFVEAAFQ
jgi:hypothetical protein